MSTTSRKVVYAAEDGIGIPIEEEVDANLFGTGTEGLRPGSGTTAGDMYIVIDGGGSFYRLDIWDGAAWKNSQGDPVGARGGGAHGDVLYRGASTWLALTAGAAGTFLKSNGVGNAPAWDSPAAIAHAQIMSRLSLRF